MSRVPVAIAAAILWLACGWAVASAPQIRLAGALSPAERAATGQLLEQGLAKLPPAWSAALDQPIALALARRPAAGRARQCETLVHRPWTGACWMPGWRVRRFRAKAIRPRAPRWPHCSTNWPTCTTARPPVAWRAIRACSTLAGWQVAALGPGRRARNDFRDRSPDTYELESPTEYVAVNLEHYLLDPDYACRRPALAAHLDAHFGWTPPGRGACAAGLLFVGDEMRVDDPQRLLDPERIHEVDYLLAEGNDRAMSL